MSKRHISKDGWTLYHISTGLPVRMEQKFQHERDEKPVILTGGRPPQHENSTGRIWMQYRDGSTGEYFPHVYGLQWVPDMSAQIKVGDRVAYKATFLRSIGDYSHARASMRGTVVEVTEWLATVDWGDGKPRGVHAGNLVRSDRIHLEPV